MAGRVTCVGGTVIDRKLHLYEPPKAGTSNPARMVVVDGGVARNVAETLARLGVDAALVSRVGDDEPGRAILANLTAVGVDTSGVAAVPGGHTAEYIAVLAGPSLVLGVAAMDVLDEIGSEDLDRGWPQDDTAAWVLLDCNLPEPVLGRAVARARADGVRLAVDVVSVPKVVRLPADLAGISVLFCNAHEARALLAYHGADSHGHGPELATRLQAAGAAGVVVTGPRRAWRWPTPPAAGRCRPSRQRRSTRPGRATRWWPARSPRCWPGSRWPRRSPRAPWWRR